MSRNRKNGGKNPGLGMLIFLILFFVPDAAAVLLPLVILGAVIYSIVKSAGTTQHKTTTTTTRTANGGTRTVTRTTTHSTTSLEDTFDECPKPFFCFHKDKGEHHVKRGKEVDPWDRPDINIRKYQRKE